METPTRIPTALFDFALCMKNNSNDPTQSKKFSDYIDDLAEVAWTENWGSANRILHNYIKYLFQKLSADYNHAISEDAKRAIISFTDKTACFNTGLYTENYEDIYCLFEANKMANPKSPWFLLGFFKESANELRHIVSLPNRVRMYDDPTELIYDYRLPIRVNKDHILGDPQNVARLPKDLQDPAKKTLLHRLFEGAVMEAEKRVASNYTLAVPQYFKGHIQLLLPICLTEETPQLALAIQRDAESYSARTCLTLEWAYNNARLIVKPEATWILPTQ